MTAPTTPGWYEDPEDPDQLRYFDGIVWSSHTTPRTPPAPSPRGSAQDAPPTGTGYGGYGGYDQGQQPGWGQPPGQNPWSAPPVPSSGTSPWQLRSAVLPDGAVLAEWWRRLLGRIIDAFLVALLTAVVAWPYLQSIAAAFDTYVQEALQQAEQGGTPDTTGLEQALSGVILPFSLITLAVGLVYETLFLVWRSATPGKMLLGTTVRRVEHAGGVTLVDALKRQVLTVVANLLSLLPLIGLLGTLLSIIDPAWLLWDPKRQALHDKVADTVVVLRRS